MPFSGAAVAPVDVGAVEQCQIFDLKQDARRKPRIIFVERGLEREAARSAEEVDKHRHWSPVEPQFKPFQLADCRRARECFGKQRAGLRRTIERRSIGAFPSAAFEREKLVNPFCQPVVSRLPCKGKLAFFGQAVFLPPQFLAFLAAHCGFEIGVGR